MAIDRCAEFDIQALPTLISRVSRGVGQIKLPNWARIPESAARAGGVD